MSIHALLSTCLRALMWVCTGLSVIALLQGRWELWLALHAGCTGFTALLAARLSRSARAWALGNALLPFLPALWLTARPPSKSDYLSACDTCWYAMERPLNPMVVVGLMFLEAPPDRQALEGVLRERLLSFRRFRQRPVGDHGHLRWEEAPGFDLSQHLTEETLPAPDEALFRARVDDITSQALPMDRPLWHLHLIKGLPGGAALVIRVHHCIGDGIALVRVLLSLTEGDAPVTPKPSLPREKPGSLETLQELLRAVPRLVMAPDGQTSFKHPLTGRRRTAWSAALPLAPLKSIAHARGAKLNDLILAATAGALRRYFTERGEPVDHMTFRVLVPVNLRAMEAAIELGNHVGFIYLPMPVGEPDRIERLKTVKATMDRVKSGKEALLSWLSLCFLGTLPRRLQWWMTDAFNRNASSTMTNVPGPRHTLHLAGREITAMSFFGPQSGQMGVGISLFSYRDTVTLAINADAGMVPDAAAVTRAFEAEMAEWLATNG